MPRFFLAAAGVALALSALAPTARADDATTVTVQGTSDVSDSRLVQSVIKPGFEAAYPQFTLNYVAPPGGTGAAFTAAQAGAGSAVVVHAPSLENQFVAAGFSSEPYGRAIFYGDFVILGPASDPAHVLTDAPHDAAKAFADIAAAGVAGTADFVSRGGAPGTTVAEHAIWALAGAVGGVNFCTVSAAGGGGLAPSNVTGACPAVATSPGWYHTTGLSQAPNVTAADTCTAGTFPSGKCYTITDRGTFNYLQSTGAIANLTTVTRDNAATAAGGSTLLINSFHAYAVNPNANFTGGARPQLNLAGATAFLNYLTSPAAQAAVGRYLSSGGDPPFLPSASPALTGSAVAATVTAGSPVTVTGSLRNQVPGTPVLAGETVSLTTPTGPVASATTDAAGNYRLTYTPVANASYSVSTPTIAKVENTTLDPVFGDLLTPASVAVGSTTVQSTIKVSGVTTGYRRATVAGTVAPGTGHKAGSVSVLARKKGSRGAFVSYAKAEVTGATYSVAVKLPPGAWELQTRYDDPGVVLSAVAPTVSTTVAGASSVKLSRVAVSGRDLTLTGSVSPAPKSSGGYVRLLGRHTRRLASGSAAKYRTIGGKVKVAKGRRSFTLHARVTRGYRWQLRVEYVHKNVIDTSKSNTRTINVR